MGELREVEQTIIKNDIKLNCITLDFCNELAEDSEEERTSKPKEGESENQ